jgi:hypothetical protein
MVSMLADVPASPSSSVRFRLLPLPLLLLPPLAPLLSAPASCCCCCWAVKSAAVTCNMRTGSPSRCRWRTASPALQHATLIGQTLEPCKWEMHFQEGPHLLHAERQGTRQVLVHVFVGHSATSSADDDHSRPHISQVSLIQACCGLCYELPEGAKACIMSRSYGIAWPIPGCLHMKQHVARRHCISDGIFDDLSECYCGLEC